MDPRQIRESLPSSAEKIQLDGTFRTKYRGFAVFLICCALLLAAFAFSAVWMNRGGFDWFFSKNENVGTETGDGTDTGFETESLPISEDGIPEELPTDATPIVSMDLSYPSLGTSYIHNETVYAPSVAELLSRPLTLPNNTDKPTVLILHTHTSESYLPKDTAYVTSPMGDLTYSRDPLQNMLAVGETLTRVLNEKGITAIHCTVMHDDPTLSGSYERMEESVKKYLEIYPSIELVIDLHRDSVTTAGGEIVRSSAGISGEPTAQVMAVVGTDGNGTDFPHWEENLALALQLRERLNQNGAAVCRPVSLRNASFYQELAKHSLLLEIGTAANSLEEAKRAAILVGEALAEMIQSLQT
ncbi:MAG: stage II sporulation protein P [Clostridia bacterium]|nr:stage II sporulation protein P [Clostridia bacterium]